MKMGSDTLAFSSHHNAIAVKFMVNLGMIQIVSCLAKGILMNSVEETKGIMFIKLNIMTLQIVNQMHLKILNNHKYLELT